MSRNLDNSDDHQIFNMDIFFVIEHIKSAITVVLDLKFEDLENKLVEIKTQER